MFYTLLKFLLWALLIGVIGGVIGWLLRGLRCAREEAAQADEITRLRAVEDEHRSLLAREGRASRDADDTGDMPLPAGAAVSGRSVRDGADDTGEIPVPAAAGLVGRSGDDDAVEDGDVDLADDGDGSASDPGGLDAAHAPGSAAVSTSDESVDGETGVGDRADDVAGVGAAGGYVAGAASDRRAGHDDEPSSGSDGAADGSSVDDGEADSAASPAGAESVDAAASADGAGKSESTDRASDGSGSSGESAGGDGAGSGSGGDGGSDVAGGAALGFAGATAGQRSHAAPNMTGAREAFGRRVDVNDLKLVEGIGPKIEELMHRDGITTWAELAAAPLERLERILQEGGNRFRMADPGTWAQQSGLAAKGDWAGLKRLQDELNAGRD